MKRKTSGWVIITTIIVGMLILWSIAYVCFSGNIDDSFDENFFANFLADIPIAIIFGLIINWYIKIKSTKKRRVEILKLIKSELEDNIIGIKINKKRLDPDEPQEWDYCLPGLKDNTWKAISAGGEINVFDDESLSIIDNISKVYHRISVVKGLEILFNNKLINLDGAKTYLYIKNAKELIFIGYNFLDTEINEILDEINLMDWN